MLMAPFEIGLDLLRPRHQDVDVRVGDRREKMVQPQRHVGGEGPTGPQHRRCRDSTGRKRQEPTTRLTHESTPRLFPLAYTGGSRASSTLAHGSFA